MRWGAVAVPCEVRYFEFSGTYLKQLSPPIFARCRNRLSQFPYLEISRTTMSPFTTGISNRSDANGESVSSLPSWYGKLNACCCDGDLKKIFSSRMICV